MSLAYDTILTDRTIPNTPVFYTSMAASNLIEYPASDTYNVMGPLYLPKIYGKDLTAFELASSGTIAVTIKDVYSFDLDRPDANTVLFQTKNDDRLLLASSSNAAVLIDGINSLVAITASNEISLAASNTAFVVIDGASKNLDVSACNNVTQVAGQDFNIWADRFYVNGELFSSSNANDSRVFGARNSNAYIKITDSNMDIYAQNEVHFMMSNHTLYDNEHDFILNTETLAVAAKTTVGFTIGDSMTTTTGTSYSIVSGGDTDVTANASMNLLATSSMGLTSLGPMTQNMVGCTTTNTADHVEHITGSNVQSSMNSALSSSANTTLASVGQTTVTSSGTDIHAVHDFSADADNVIINAAKNFTLTAGVSNVSTASNNSVVSINDLDISTGHQTYIASVAGTFINDLATFSLVAPAISTSGSTLLETMTTSIKTTAPAVACVAADSYSVSAGYSSFTSATTALFQGSNLVKIQNDNDTSINIVPSQIAVHMDSVDVLVVTPSNVTINGELRVNGDFTSITTYQETLQIFDKQITLSGGASNGIFADGALTNSGSGMIISGFPSDDNGVTLKSDAVASGSFLGVPLYEKSIRMYCPSDNAVLHLNNIPGEDSLAAFDAESYWEVKGGDLRLTLLKDAAGDFTTFGFRIGKYDELELVKKWSVGGVVGSKVVSKFGRVLANNLVL